MFLQFLIELARNIGGCVLAVVLYLLMLGFFVFVFQTHPTWILYGFAALLAYGLVKDAWKKAREKINS